jgi:hypothetical protein
MVAMGIYYVTVTQAPFNVESFLCQQNRNMKRYVSATCKTIWGSSKTYLAFGLSATTNKPN